jgi:hypothetical protein
MNRVIATGLILLLTAGCGSESSNGKAPAQGDAGAAVDTGDSGDSNVTIKAGVGPGGCADFQSSFQAIQKIIFEDHGCTAQKCHGETKQGGLDLRPDAAYKSLVDAKSSNSMFARVQPGTAKESYLYLKLAAATEPGSVEIAGSPMPVSGAPLSAQQLAAVELWIKKGAPETGFAADARSMTDVGSLLGSCLQPLEPITVTPLEPPAANEGFQYLLPSYLLKAGSEVENCTEFAFDFTDKVPPEFKDEARNVIFVNGARVRQDAQSHHLVLYNGGHDLSDIKGDLSTWTCREGARDGQSCDPHNGSADCGDGGVCAGVSAGFGGSCSPVGGRDGFSPQVANTQAPQAYIPPRDGVYWEVPLRGTLAFNSHAFNLTDKDTTLHARVNFYYTREVGRKLVPVNFTNYISIAAGQAPFTTKMYCAKYVVPLGNSMTLLAVHTHRRGVRTWVNHPAMGMIYENLDYNDPLYKKFEPWLDFNEPDDASRTLEYCATYNNGLKENNEADLELVTRASRMPERTSCKPVACVAGKLMQACSTNADCDTAPGAGDGSCDACTITAGTTTENEMFVLMPWLARPEEK